MKLTKEDILKYGTVEEQKGLKEGYEPEVERRALYQLGKRVNNIIGLLRQMNQEDIKEYDLDLLVSNKEYVNFTDYISRATIATMKAKEIIQRATTSAMEE